MTAAQTGVTEYDAESVAPSGISTQHTFAAEFLAFYKHVAAFQRTFRATIAASSNVKSGSALSAELRNRRKQTPFRCAAFFKRLRSVLFDGGLRKPRSGEGVLVRSRGSRSSAESALPDFTLLEAAMVARNVL